LGTFIKIYRESVKLAKIYIKSWRCNADSSLRLKWYQVHRPSVSMYVSAWLLLDVFLWNLILEVYMKILRKIPYCVQIGQKYWELYMKNSIGFLLLATLKHHKSSRGLKRHQDFSPSVRLPASISAAPTERIYVKFVLRKI